MRYRWIDAVVLLLIVAACTALYFRQVPGEEPLPPASPSPGAEGPAPSFTVPLMGGGELHSEEGMGPLVVLMTAPVSCGSCRSSGAVDLEAEKAAAARGVPVYHVFVGVPPDQAGALSQELGTSPELTGLDPDWKACQALGGSDSSCWVVLDREGRKAWQGGRDLAALEKAVETVRVSSEAEAP